MIGRDRRDAASSQIVAAAHTHAHHIGFSGVANHKRRRKAILQAKPGGTEIPST
jgi:hypothetical protein